MLAENRNPPVLGREADPISLIRKLLRDLQPLRRSVVSWNSPVFEKPVRYSFTMYENR
jgi:hypothetical protein